jgi:HD-GYP domain-containing protein (c-di-GMP phosphodiesterase class II)
MYPKISVNLGNLVLSLSDALDLAFSSLAMHQQRVAFIAWELGRQAKLEDKRVEHVFLTGLLHDIGALSTEEKISLHLNETLQVEPHCIRGKNIFKSNPWLAPCADLVRYHHRDWVSWEEPRDTPEVFDSQILYLADYLERQIDRSTYILHQNETLSERIKELADKQISQAVIDLFLETSRREEFWLDLASPRLYSLLLHNGPLQTVEVDINNILIFAKFLGMIVDFKSPFTATHSSGVARCSMILAEMVGMSESELQLMEAAGLLHDLGKLVVPNSILEKPARLTPAEMAVMKQHTYHTFSILSSIAGLQMIAEWSAYHHERLDGKGYPFRREGHEMNIGARIMAVSDIFTALSEDRPYRKGMDLKQITKILRDMASHGIHDSRIVKLLLQNIEDIRKTVLESQEQARHFYRTEVEKKG